MIDPLTPCGARFLNSRSERLDSTDTDLYHCYTGFNPVTALYNLENYTGFNPVTALFAAPRSSARKLTRLAFMSCVPPLGHSGRGGAALAEAATASTCCGQYPDRGRQGCALSPRAVSRAWALSKSTVDRDSHHRGEPLDAALTLRSDVADVDCCARRASRAQW